jgi:hypothetical protein
LKQKKPTVLDITGFFFRMSTQTSAFTWVLMRKKKPVISNTGKFFCFNNNVSNLYNNGVVENINGMAYIFTLLMFRKPNKTTINKNKMTNLYRSTSFRISFIFWYFKVFQVKRIVYIEIFQGLSSVPNLYMWSVWFVITCGRLVSCFCIARIDFKSSQTRQFWT